MYATYTTNWDRMTHFENKNIILQWQVIGESIVNFTFASKRFSTFSIPVGYLEKVLGQKYE